MNPYLRYVSELARLVREGKQFPLGGFPKPSRTAVASDAPVALIFSPHPDDECIIGGLALRLRREAGMRVVNVAVTQGSNKARRAGRVHELKAACDYLEFGLIHTAPGGLEDINVKTRTADPARWQASVEVIAGILADQQPAVVFFPHDSDWNSTHIGTHYLLHRRASPAGRRLRVSRGRNRVLGRDGHAQSDGRIESGRSGGDDDGVVVPRRRRCSATRITCSCRRGCRTTYGAEESWLAVKAGAAPDFVFCTLYRLRRWRDGRLRSDLCGWPHSACRDERFDAAHMSVTVLDCDA